jgi:hypothetical protein
MLEDSRTRTAQNPQGREAWDQLRRLLKKSARTERHFWRALTWEIDGPLVSVAPRISGVGVDASSVRLLEKFDGDGVEVAIVSKITGRVGFTNLM